MADKKKAKGWNLAEMQETLIKDTEQKIEQGFKELAEQGGGASSPSVASDTQGTVPVVTSEISQRGSSYVPSVVSGEAERPSVTGFQEPTQNINIPIPASQHTRLKIISAQTRQTMKDMVVQAIGLWLDVQEGKVEIKK